MCLPFWIHILFRVNNLKTVKRKENTKYKLISFNTASGRWSNVGPTNEQCKAERGLVFEWESPRGTTVWKLQQIQTTKLLASCGGEQKTDRLQLKWKPHTHTHAHTQYTRARRLACFAWAWFLTDPKGRGGQVLELCLPAALWSKAAVPRASGP